MNFLLFTQDEVLNPERIILTGRRFAHLMKINKAKENDTFKCGIINGNLGTAQVIKIHPDAVEMRILRLDKKPPEALPLILILALPRPKMLRRIIESATSLGVKDIFLINSWRVEKSFWQSPILAVDKLKKSMILGLEQCGDTIMPTITKKRLFSPFVNQELTKIAENSVKILAHPRGDLICPCGINAQTTLAIGPEGGFIEREVATFKKYGFDICRIGSRILRVETAVPSIISRLFI